MSEDQSSSKVPKLSNQDSGRQRFKETTRPIVYEGEIDWAIDDFLRLVRFQNTVQSSQYKFRFGQTDYTFMLELRLEGDDIELWLFSLNECTLTVDYEIKALCASGHVLAFVVPSVRLFDTTNPAWGCRNFLSKNRLEADDKDDSDSDDIKTVDVNGKEVKEAETVSLPGGSLRLICKFTIFLKEVSDVLQNPATSWTDEEGLMSDTRKLWSTGLLHDFIIKCDGREFECHRAILGSRSKYFETLFTVDMSEKKQNFLKIEDVNADKFSDFLEFVYTDNLSDHSSFESVDLLILADRFQFDNLKRSCELALAETVSLANAVKFLSIGHTYSAGYLQKVAATFVRDNRRSLFGSPDWKEMVKSNPEAMEALFIDY